MFKEKITRNGSFVVKCTGSDEPNNSRVIWRVAFFLNGQDITDKITSWNYLNFHLKRWDLESLDGRFVYLPVEGEARLFDLVTKKVKLLSKKSLSTIEFNGNFFTDSSLVEVYTDEVIVTNLTTL